MSLSSIYSKEIDEDKQWLTYWVIFGGVNFIDYILGPFDLFDSLLLHPEAVVCHIFCSGLAPGEAF